jgi:acetylglutamate kinase
MENLFIIKIGGNVIDDAGALADFLRSLSGVEGKKILVHGGGKVATQVGDQLGIASQYVNGRRITDAATLEVVTMVYGGLVNKNIVAQLQQLGCNAIGLTGADGNLLRGKKRAVKAIDYGFAGDVLAADVNRALLVSLLEAGLMPVLAPLTHDGAGQLLNTNADTIASVVAVALSGQYTTRLLYCFEKRGVLRDVADEDSVIAEINPTNYMQLLTEGVLADGMIPKLENALEAVKAGVAEVLIGSAKDIAANMTGEVRGTVVRREG